jgi:hypothetical protein
MTHCLKTIQPWFDHVAEGTKTFELRKNDRGFKIGDRLFLQEWDEIRERYTGREIEVIVRGTMERFAGLCEGFILLMIERG